LSWFLPRAIDLTERDTQLLRVLERAQRLGLVGRGVDLADQVAHARAFMVTGPPADGFPGVDLGSGNGLPGLVLACDWESSRWWLSEASVSRCEFLRWAVSALGLEGRVQILEGPAERLGQEREYRGKADLVVARSFAQPAPTAECAAGFLRRGGRLVVSEPPAAEPNRWPAESLSQLGFELADASSAPVKLQVLVRSGELSESFPRREGLPRRRPLF